MVIKKGLDHQKEQPSEELRSEHGLGYVGEWEHSWLWGGAQMGWLWV